MIQLSDQFSEDEITYALQGNAVLGIRDSGKTYTSTYMAERLLDAGIPFVAFDPIGVWRYLRVGAKGHKGYKVVVAGDEGDLPLTVETAPRIVRAAMRENIPLVLDLYSMKLTKVQWRRIVQESVELLLQENTGLGPRHIFIEEAAEFVPQRVMPEQGKVYAALESLGRMGRNASLGFTIINQRSEDVNKSMLELCDCVFLHRQKGRNSLNNLSKWLDILDTTEARGIIKALPTLPQGQCYVLPEGSSDAFLVKIPKKNTVHPDPKAAVVSTRRMGVDVNDFINRIGAQLEKQQEEVTKAVTKTGKVVTELELPDGRVLKSDLIERRELEAKRQEYEQRLIAVEKEKNDRIRQLEAENVAIRNRLDSVRDLLKPQYESLQTLFSEIGNGHTGQANTAMYEVWLNKLTGKKRDMLQILIDQHRVTKTQLGLLVGMSPRGGSFNTYLSSLRSLKLVRSEGEYVVLNEE